MVEPTRGAKPPEDATLDDDVSAVTSAVLTASRLLVAVSMRSLAAAEEPVTLPQFRLLMLLDGHGETNLVTLADRLLVNSSTALRMVDRLVNRGMISRRVNPASRREVLLQLTARGQRIVEEVTARRREEIAGVVVKMHARDRARLVKALQSFTVALGDPAEENGSRAPIRLAWE